MRFWLSGVEIETYRVFGADGAMAISMRPVAVPRGNELSISAQVGAAMKDLQPKAQAALKKHLVLESVLPQTEGDAVATGEEVASTVGVG